MSAGRLSPLNAYNRLSQYASNSGDIDSSIQQFQTDDNKISKNKITHSTLFLLVCVIFTFQLFTLHTAVHFSH